MIAPVECRSDWTYAQRPRAFIWQGERLTIQEIITERRTPSGKSFTVRTVEQGNFELSYDQHSDNWTVQPKPSKELT